MTEMKNIPKYSVVIAACNVEAYIDQCLKSLRAQTLGDFQAIVINDCSTDGTREAIEKVVSEDSRFTLINKPEREGPHLARKTGTGLAKGVWTLFLDGDDEMSEDALAILDTYISSLPPSEQPDILRFARSVSSENPKTMEEAKAVEGTFNVKTDGLLKGGEILRSVFSRDDDHQRSSWSIISMAVKTDVLQDAFNVMSEERLGRIEDSYEFFVLADTAETYAYFDSEPLYIYHWGRGITGTKLISLDSYEKNLKGIAATLRALDRYCCSHDSQIVHDCHSWLCQNLPRHISTDMVLRVNVKDEHDAVIAFAKVWGSQVVSGELARLIVDRARRVLEEDVHIGPKDELWRLLDFYQEIVDGTTWPNINDAPYGEYYAETVRLALDLVGQICKEAKAPRAITTTTARRLAIFCFYDPKGHAARYIETLLTDLMRNVSDLIVVVNGSLDEPSRWLFERFTDQIVVRENIGLDAAAYKEVLLDQGWDVLARYDEVICLNDTVLGPVYPFSEMFAEMDSRKVDFWGITAYHSETVNNEFIPTHLQAYWHAYRRSLVQSRDFQEYWENLPIWRSYADVTHKHEMAFTAHFAKLGYSWSAYVNQEKYQAVSSYPLLYSPTDLVRDDRCPVFKKRSFFVNYDTIFDQTAGQPAMDLYDYLRDHTTYQTDLIWDAILPNYNIEDIRKAMHLTYVLSNKADRDMIRREMKSAFIYHIYFLDLLDETYRYLSRIPEETDIYITTTSDKVDKVDHYLKSRGFERLVHFIPVVNRGRDVSALLVGARSVILDGDYDVVGFAHDKKSSQNQESGHHGTETQGFAYKLLENTLGSTSFIRHVLDLFAKNPRLGMLSPLPPYHALYFAHTLPTDWGPNFVNTRNLLEHRLHLKAPLDESKATMSAIGSCYWFRVSALRPLFAANWQYEDFPPEGQMGVDGSISHAIERVNGYVVQSQGYYPAWVLNDRYARVEIDSLLYTTNSLIRSMGAARNGETLLANCDSLRRGMRSSCKYFRVLKRNIHRGLQVVAKHVVQPLPEPIRSVIYRTAWFPLIAYRRMRDGLRRSFEADRFSDQKNNQ